MESRTKLTLKATFEQTLGLLKVLLQKAPFTGVETVPLLEAQGRVLAQPILAAMSSPLGMLSGMDGIALKEKPEGITGECVLVEGRDFAFVDTGNPIPEPFDRVLMIERVSRGPLDGVLIDAKDWPEPFDNVRLLAEDIARGEVILPKGRRVSREAVCLAAVAGVTQVSAAKRPVGSIVPTGSEILPVGSPVVFGHILDTNSLYIERTIEKFGGIAKRLPPVPDDPALIASALRGALETSDFVFLVAGTSAGRHDYAHGAIEGLGEVLLHGVQVKPGKPLLIGEASGKPVIGVPGYPFSAFVWIDALVPVIIQSMMGQDPLERVLLQASAVSGISRTRKVREVLRVKLLEGHSKKEAFFVPLSSVSSRMRPTVDSDGDVVLETGVTDLGVSETQEVQLKGVYLEAPPKGLILGLIEPCLEMALADLRSALRIGWASETFSPQGMLKEALKSPGVFYASSLHYGKERLRVDEGWAFVPLFTRSLGVWHTPGRGTRWARFDPDSDIEWLFEKTTLKCGRQRPKNALSVSRPLQMMELLDKGKIDSGFGGAWGPKESVEGLGFEEMGEDLYGLWASRRTIEGLVGFKEWLYDLKGALNQAKEGFKPLLRVKEGQGVLSFEEAGALLGEGIL